MANTPKKVGRTEVVELTDGREVTLRPLNIKTLKVFMRKFKELQSGFDEELEPDEVEYAIMDILVDCAAIALSPQLPKETGYLNDKTKDREAFEELVDQDTVEYINEVCGGLNLRVNGELSVDGENLTSNEEGDR